MRNAITGIIPSPEQVLQHIQLVSELIHSMKQNHLSGLSLTQTDFCAGALVIYDCHRQRWATGWCGEGTIDAALQVLHRHVGRPYTSASPKVHNF